MMSDLNEVISELHSKLDIVEIISRYVKLKKQGANFVGLCPFHKEKTPSFVVSPAKQIFHCFGCGASGDLVKFIMMIENIDFKEAITKLANEASIEPPTFRSIKGKSSNTEEIYRFNELLSDYFQSNLDKEVLSYLKEKRFLKDSTIDLFKIGFATKEYDSFLKKAKEDGFEESIFIKSGAFKKTERGEIFPYFRERIIFPVWNLDNKIVGFSGRSFNGSEPKYLNTPETEIFKKGSILYGLNLTKDEIKLQKNAIIVEGYFDVILLNQEGIKYAVSSMGTSFTEEHAKLIARFAEKIFFFFDNDAGGRMGAERAIETCSKLELQPLIVLSKEEKDPDEIIVQNGKDEIIRLLKEAKDPIIFITEFESAKNGSDPQGKSKTVEKLIEVTSKISKKTVIYEYLKKISNLLDIELRFLVDEYNRTAKRGNKRITPPNLEIRTEKFGGIQKIITQALLQRPETMSLILKNVNIENDFEEPFKKIALRAISDISSMGKIDIAMWNDITDDEFKFASQLALEDETLVSNESISQTIKAYKNYKFYSEEISRIYDEIKNTQNENEKFSKLREYQAALKKMKEG